ncbi:ferritin-like domain-containing protein [Reyranella sp.]|uniref:ferritin-like domain-containing protein n=1 Tax=Reyranella sp. TaxID=1929291 RepID=UPI003782D94D
MAQQITYDKAYDAVGPEDFSAMIEVPRYGRRSDAFDAIISATHDHFWDPLDKTYLDFDAPFDMATTPILPLDMVLELRSAVRDRLDEGQQVQLANDVTHWSVSNLLHGEQGALSLSASLCHILLDPGAQEYAANQAREEARHVAGFTRYIAKRWGDPLPVGATIATVLSDLVGTPEVYKKIVGMQMLIEGLAMGSFATINAKTSDPVLRRLVQLVMSDEAFHHRFGRIWANKTIRHLNEDEHRKVEDWAAQLFQMLLFNLINAEQKQVIYVKYGLDWQWVRDAVKETFGDEERRAQLKDSTNIFRVLIKTLLHAGIITSRTAPLYAVWVDMKELEAEGDGIPGDVVAEEMLVVLREINARRKRIASKDVAATAA